MGILPTSICQLHKDLFRRSSKYFKQEFGTAIELRGFPALSIGEIINCCHKIGIVGVFVMCGCFAGSKACGREAWGGPQTIGKHLPTPTHAPRGREKNLCEENSASSIFKF